MTIGYIKAREMIRIDSLSILKVSSETFDLFTAGNKKSKFCSISFSRLKE